MDFLTVFTALPCVNKLNNQIVKTYISILGMYGRHDYSGKNWGIAFVKS